MGPKELRIACLLVLFGFSHSGEHVPDEVVALSKMGKNCNSEEK